MTKLFAGLNPGFVNASKLTYSFSLTPPPTYQACGGRLGACGNIPLNFFNRKRKFSISRFYCSINDTMKYEIINKDNYKEISPNDFSLVKGSYEYQKSIGNYRKLRWNARTWKDYTTKKLGSISDEIMFKRILIFKILYKSINLILLYLIVSPIKGILL